jgi:hypothetical protein
MCKYCSEKGHWCWLCPALNNPAVQKFFEDEKETEVSLDIDSAKMEFLFFIPSYSNLLTMENAVF